MLSTTRHAAAVPYATPLTPDQLHDVVSEAFDGTVNLGSWKELSEGSFNAAYELTLADSRRFVLKVAPAAGSPTLTYERDLLGTEALCLREQQAAAVPGPRLIAHRRAECSPVGRDWLLTTVLPGASWSSRRAAVTQPQRRLLRRALGAHIAALHVVTGAKFGYPGVPELQAPTWSEAYSAIISALLADADRYDAPLPLPTSRIGAALRPAAETRLAGVTAAVLAHFDLWEGNVFVDLDGARPLVTGCIDGERALWADPAVDFVSPALLGDIADDEDLLSGYASGGGPVVLDDATRARLPLYRAHLALVMLVEAVPRGTAGPEHAEWNGRVARWLLQQLDALSQG